MSLFADVWGIQPLIDFFEAILLFFHDSIGLGWGFSIIALTILVRACLLPLTFKQFHSMQRLAQLQPEMKKLQERHKGDKERMNQEMMKFYRENKVNPFASCLPMVAQFPVFISLYYMLRLDLRHDMCPQLNPTTDNTVPCGPIRRVGVLLHQRPDGQGHRHGPGDPDRPLRRLAAVLDAADVDDDGQDAALHLHGAPVHLRHVRDPVPGGPARLLDHHEPVDDRAAGDHQEAPRAAAARHPRTGQVVAVCSALEGTRELPRRPRRYRTGRRRSGRTKEPAGVGSEPKGRPATRPPSPPRKKKKRSGRRR